MHFQLSNAVPVLERTPATLDAMLRDLPADWTDADEGPETWSPWVVLGHLVHGERTDWMPRATMILAQQPGSTFEPYDRFAQFHESAGRTMAELLDQFAALRRANLDTLRALHLTEAQLELTGTHPAFGTVTLRQLLATWVAHDLGHIAQVSRVMAKQYRDAVGPWRQYLPVLDR